MNTKQIGIVFRKELMDTLRDRRTLISSILVPILLFPVLILGFIGLAILVTGRAVRENPELMVLGAEHAPQLAERLKNWKRSSQPGSAPAGSLSGIERLVVVPASANYSQLINDKKIRAAVEFPPGFEANLRSNPDQTQVVKVYWFEGEFRSRAVVRIVERLVREFSDKVVTERLSARGLSDKWLTPFTFEKSNVAPPEKVSGSILGFMLPYFIIILCLTGAMNPAMDLTAGEKERGTMETILASPVRRVELVIGKFLLVLLSSAVTTALSIASFALSFLLGVRLFQEITTRFALTVSGKAIAAVLFLVLPLAVLFSAALLAIAVFARNYREAQTYIGPLMFLVILPAMASFIPGIELNTRLALIPVLNVSLMAKEVLSGSYNWPLISIIFGSTCVYAGIALFLAVRQFHREEVLFRT
jgi:sodium transport system permease protein